MKVKRQMLLAVGLVALIAATGHAQLLRRGGVTRGKCGNPRCVMCYGASAQRLLAQDRRPQIVTPSQETTPVIESTPEHIVDAMLAWAELSPADLLYDLGCGDGRILKRAVQTYGCRAVGIEIDPEVAAIAERNCESLPIRIVTGDARKFLYPDATVVAMYLDQDLMLELIPKLTHVRRIVSNSHPVPGWDNRQVIVEDTYPFYVATPPAVVVQAKPWRRMESKCPE